MPFARGIGRARLVPGAGWGRPVHRQARPVPARGRVAADRAAARRSGDHEMLYIAPSTASGVPPYQGGRAELFTATARATELIEIAALAAAEKLAQNIVA